MIKELTTNNNEKTEYNFAITVDQERIHTKKPKGEIVKRISKDLKSVLAFNAPSDLAPLITYPYGISFSVSLFKGSRSDRNWEKAIAYALDFDNGDDSLPYVTPQDIIKRCEEYKIIPNIIYNSFSNTPEKRKFRVIFVFDKIITNKKLFRFIIINFLKMFPESDKACKDLARFFYGGLELLHTDDTINSLDHVIDVLETFNIESDSGKTRKVLKNDFIEENTTPSNDENKPFDIYNIGKIDLNNNTKSTFKNNSSQKYVQFNDGNLIEHFDFKEAIKKTKIFEDFVKLKRLHHHELTGIFSSLVHIKGGFKLAKTIMTEHNKKMKNQEPYTDNSFATLTYYNLKKYFPTNNKDFSPYKEDHEHSNLIEAVRQVRGVIVPTTKQTKKMTIKEATEKFEIEFEKALQQKEGITIFKVPTGLGKTRKLEHLGESFDDKNQTYTFDVFNIDNKKIEKKITSDNPVLIAIPDNDLKEETSMRMKSKHTTTPRFPMFTDNIINDNLSFLYRAGLLDEASSYMKEVAENKKGIYCSTDSITASSYRSQNVLAAMSKETVLTTHSRAVNQTGIWEDRIHIFDEDPIHTLMSINHIKMGDFHTLLGCKKIKKHIQVIMDDLEKNALSGIYLEQKKYTIDTKAIVKYLLEKRIETPIISFLTATHIVRDMNDNNIIHFITKNDFNSKRVIILSATADEFIYKKLYGDKVNVVNLMNVEQTGKIIQDTQYSLSRTSLDNHIDKIKKYVGKTDCITFMKKKHLFENAVDSLHYGKCSGSDILKGKDIAVVGTPHIPVFVHLLFACALGVDFNPVDYSLEHIVVEYNGYRFSFASYKNKNLQKIQLGLINSEITQAVGRARTLRENCTVSLLSNFPIRETTEFKKLY